MTERNIQLVSSDVRPGPGRYSNRRNTLRQGVGLSGKEKRRLMAIPIDRRATNKRKDRKH